MNEMIEYQSTDSQKDNYPQLTTADTGWTDEERGSMCEHGFDNMDMLRAWLL